MVDFLDPTTSEFWSNAIFAFVDIFFGIMLWIVDSRSKRRQEETLQKQEDSLDIILDQVSKVNHYQTRVLSYAIETLEQDMNEMKTMIDTGIETPVEPEIEVVHEPVKTEPETAVTPSLGASIGDHFNRILKNQLSGIMENIQKSVADTQTPTEEESYKAKKGLEFDLKHVLRGLDELQSLGKEKTKTEVSKEKLRERKRRKEQIQAEREELRKQKEKIRKEARAKVPPQIIKEKDSKETASVVKDIESFEKEILSPFDQKEIKAGLDTLSDLGQDIASFTNSILESVAKVIPQDASKDLTVEMDELKRKLEEKKKERELRKKERENKRKQKEK